VALHRGIDGAEPLRPIPVAGLAGPVEERRDARSTLLAVGSLACPVCDAPVAPTTGPSAPADPLICPFCGHGARVRDFLSLEVPTRPARVTVRVILP
jgi:hypothetical protein